MIRIDAQKVSLVIRLKTLWVCVRAVLSIVKREYFLVFIVVVVLAVFKASVKVLLSKASVPDGFKLQNVIGVGITLSVVLSYHVHGSISQLGHLRVIIWLVFVGGFFGRYVVQDVVRIWVFVEISESIALQLYLHVLYLLAEQGGEVSFVA